MCTASQERLKIKSLKRKLTFDDSFTLRNNQKMFGVCVIHMWKETFVTDLNMFKFEDCLVSVWEEFIV